MLLCRSKAIVSGRVSRALAGRARHPDVALQQRGVFAGDGQTQPGAAVFARGAFVALAELFEDMDKLFGGDADARVGHGNPDCGGGRQNFGPNPSLTSTPIVTHFFNKL
jgi:hypothetical protein